MLKSTIRIALYCIGAVFVVTVFTVFAAVIAG